jgi:hypothetical protein
VCFVFTPIVGRSGVVVRPAFSYIVMLAWRGAWKWLAGASFCGWASGRKCGSAGLRLVDCGREAGGHAVCLACGGVVGGQVSSPPFQRSATDSRPGPEPSMCWWCVPVCAFVRPSRWCLWPRGASGSLVARLSFRFLGLVPLALRLGWFLASVLPSLPFCRRQ